MPLWTPNALDGGDGFQGQRDPVVAEGEPMVVSTARGVERGTFETVVLLARDGTTVLRPYYSFPLLVLRSANAESARFLHGETLVDLRDGRAHPLTRLRDAIRESGLDNQQVEAIRAMLRGPYRVPPATVARQFGLDAETVDRIANHTYRNDHRPFEKERLRRERARMARRALEELEAATRVPEGIAPLPGVVGLLDE